MTDASSPSGFFSHGFLHSAAGAFTSFDVPGAGNTYTFGFNDSGAITAIWPVAFETSNTAMSAARRAFHHIRRPRRWHWPRL
ncbi:MAG: hypothetical protein ACLQDQ_02485 [Myxococcaceae bacterium]